MGKVRIDMVETDKSSMDSPKEQKGEGREGGRLEINVSSDVENEGD